MNNYFQHKMENHQAGVQLDLRFRLAVDLMKHVGIATGKTDGEDSAGRAKLELLAPKEVVDRCFEIADYAVQLGEEKGWIKPVETTDEEAAAEVGRLEAIKLEAGLSHRRGM